MVPAIEARKRRVLLIAVDQLAIISFVVVGTISHHEGRAAAFFLRNAIPVTIAWFVAAAILQAYRRPGIRTLLLTWVIAVPTGLVARSIWVGSPTGSRLLTFVGVGLAFTLLFLLVGRTLVRLLAGRVLPAEPRK